jgi:hypothetical protein
MTPQSNIEVSPRQLRVGLEELIPTDLLRDARAVVENAIAATFPSENAKLAALRLLASETVDELVATLIDHAFILGMLHAGGDPAVTARAALSSGPRGGRRAEAYA